MFYPRKKENDKISKGDKERRGEIDIERELVIDIERNTERQRNRNTDRVREYYTVIPRETQGETKSHRDPEGMTVQRNIVVLLQLP